eukprot:scaffold203282_cov30-Tisochrysis_lutea.AAC.1
MEEARHRRNGLGLGSTQWEECCVTTGQTECILVETSDRRERGKRKRSVGLHRSSLQPCKGWRSGVRGSRVGSSEVVLKNA